ncbi:MAG: LPS export ABC transporter periplasmic protein LptC [Prevotella sp.]|nr:LPS export ABC transporter periplasmic protein LptC [Prevotella sp.]
MRYWLVFALFPLIAVSCSEAHEHTAPPIYERDSVSMMTSYAVNTLISDSGVLRYRIVTERWDVNMVKNPSRWEFMKGIFLEQFDEKFHTEGYIQADTAWYYDQKKLWKLRGRVRIRNVNGLVYTSEELYWDGLRHELYSNVFSKIVTPERTLQGTYFRSDERMMHYMVSNSAGSFQAEDIGSGSSSPTPATTSTASPAPADTAKPVAPPVRQAATRHRATPKPPVTTP